MDERNGILPKDKGNNLQENPNDKIDENKKLLEEIYQAREDISYLRDLFVRRLNDDKQKNAVIKKLTEGAEFAFIEPFLHDIILLLDRLEKSDDDYILSIKEELYDIVQRRGVKKIIVSSEFDSSLNKAVRVCESSETTVLRVISVIRNGYTFSGKVIRPAEVVLEKPLSN